MNNRSFWDKFSVWFATLFGIGYTPMCPGTASCVAAVILFVLIKNQTAFFIVTVISVVLAYAVSGRAEKVFKKKDCQFIVIDDFSGMLITLLFLPRNFWFVVTAFFLFRMLDMIKIPPANMIEKEHGAAGIVGDDVIAGLYAFGFLQLAKFLVWS